MRELTAGMGLEAARRALTRAFRDAGITTPALDARLLVIEACGVSQAELIRDPGAPLSDDARARLDQWAGRRLAGAPVSRILGRRGFWGVDLHLSPETLDPRPDTETLVEAVLATLPDRTSVLHILDLGTGTGGILIALLSELPQALGIGTDISHAALVTAHGNAQRAGVGQRARFVQADWLSGIAGRFDVIVSNPPYIPRAELGGLSREVRAYDPMAALDGGADGLDAYRAIVGGIDLLLKPGGIAAFEVGQGQAEAVGEMMAGSGLRPVLPSGAVSAYDLGGIERAVIMKQAKAAEGAKKELESRAIRASLI